MITLVFSIDGKQISIRRSFTADRIGGAWLSENGREEAVTWDEATSRLEQRLGAHRDFFRRIVYISEGAAFRYLQDRPSIALTNQIERLFGIDILQEYHHDLRSLRAEIREETSEIEEEWSGVAIPSGLPARLKDLAEKSATLDEAMRSKRREIQITTREVVDLEKTKESQESVTALIDLLVLAARTVGLLVQDSASPQDLGKSLIDVRLTALKQATQKLDEAKRQFNSISNRVTYLDDLERVARESERALLTRTTGHLCPVCKRPLKQSHVKTIFAEIKDERVKLKDASARTKASISALEREVRDLETKRSEAERTSAELLAYVRQLKVRSIGEVRDIFQGIDKKQTEARSRLTKLEKEAEALNKQAKVLADETAGLEAARRQAEQMAASRSRQVQLRASEFLSETLARAISDAVEKERRTNVSVIQTNLSRLWSKFHKAQERIEFLPDGEMFLLRDGDRLPFDHLSGGEKTVLLVLSHTIASRALSNLDFLLIDEPLEHLDLENRRSLMNFLVQAAKRQFISQMIVSTFEESLTRKYLEEPYVHPVYLFKPA